MPAIKSKVNLFYNLKNYSRALEEIENVLKKEPNNQSMYRKKGDIFSEKNLTVKRPGNGISPLNWDKLIGKKSEINYKPDMLIKW